MKSWFAPVALLGLSGLGLLITSERGGNQLRAFVEHLGRHGDPIGEFHSLLDGQLRAIQDALDHLAEALEEQQA